MAQTTIQKPKQRVVVPGTDQRLLIWRQVRGMWKRRKPDPAKELMKIRKEWGR